MEHIGKIQAVQLFLMHKWHCFTTLRKLEDVYRNKQMEKKVSQVPKSWISIRQAWYDAMSGNTALMVRQKSISFR
jgi:hypothetical protein